MKAIRKYSPLLFTFCFVLAAVLCIGGLTQAAPDKTIKTVSIEAGGKKVTRKIISLQKGKSKTLKVSTSPKLSKKTITFKSSKPSVVSVDKKGKLTAKKVGTSKISITVKAAGYKNKTVSVSVKVTNGKSGKALVHRCINI